MVRGVRSERRSIQAQVHPLSWTQGATHGLLDSLLGLPASEMGRRALPPGLSAEKGAPPGVRGFAVGLAPRKATSRW